jgi:hypothetical protein
LSQGRGSADGTTSSMNSMITTELETASNGTTRVAVSNEVVPLFLRRRSRASRRFIGKLCAPRRMYGLPSLANTISLVSRIVTCKTKPALRFGVRKNSYEKSCPSGNNSSNTCRCAFATSGVGKPRHFLALRSLSHLRQCRLRRRPRLQSGNERSQLGRLYFDGLQVVKMTFLQAQDLSYVLRRDVGHRYRHGEDSCMRVGHIKTT